MIRRRRMRVLLVEDNKADARLVQELLNQTGMPTQETLVGYGEMAIQVMEKAENGEGKAPDLVLLDIDLPKKNGYEVLASIKDYAREAHTYIAMCSGSSSYEDVRKAQFDGANAYLIKPTGVEEMEEIITRLRNILVSLDEESSSALYC